MRWEEVGEAARFLAAAVHAAGARPDIILAVARGGLIPAAALGYALGVKNTFTMNVEFYTDRRAPGGADGAAARPELVDVATPASSSWTTSPTPA